MKLLFLALVFIFLGTKTVSSQPSVVQPNASVLDRCVAGSENHLQLPDNQIIQHGSRDRKEIALTFDADMTPEMKQAYESGRVKSWYNKKVIEVLESTHTPATLFLTGMWIELYKNETKELAKNPLFELENHSYSHPGFHGTCYGLTPVNPASASAEIAKTKQLLKDVAGVDNAYFRFPGGCYSDKELKLVRDQGLETVHWDTIGDDGFNHNAQNIVNNVLSTAQNGSIIVLHMHGGPFAPLTADALPAIISNLKSRGFTFVKVSELLQ